MRKRSPDFTTEAPTVGQGGVCPACRFLWALVAAVLVLLPWGQAPGRCGTAAELLRGAASLTCGDFATAESTFGSVRRVDGVCAVAAAGEGAARLLAGGDAEAMGSFQEALSLQADLCCAYVGLAAAFSLQGDYREALEQYRMATAARPLRPGGVLAGEAYAACALGLYDTGAGQARAALAAEPDEPLAGYVLAAAELARGNPAFAAQLAPSQRLFARTPVRPIALGSCLLQPGVAFWETHAAEDRARLAVTGLWSVPEVRGARTATAGPAPPLGLSIERPGEGAVLEGAVTIEVSAPRVPELQYVSVSIGERQVGVVSFAPYSLNFDTRRLPDGPAQIRADAYDTRGAMAATATVAVTIRNGNRTLAPSELAARQRVAEMLEQLLLPSIPSPTRLQLAGHGLSQLGQVAQAAAAFEGAFSYDPAVPGLREDLALAYRDMGLTVSATPREIRSLADPKAVALTFDDGPHPLITPWVLDELDKGRAKATFFLVGKQATLYPELVREIRRRGHEIGSHSYAHYSLRHLTEVECAQDLVKSRLALREACGETVELFRPPGGYYDGTVRRAVGATGFVGVFWTCNITSYPGLEGKRIAADMGRKCANGGIILLHNGEDETLDTLPYLIPELRQRGLRFVTIRPEAGELARAGTVDERGR